MSLSMVMLLIIFLSLVSMAYVYRYRGITRYDDLSEYLRKGWPITTPFNSVLYLFTQKRAKKPIMNTKDFKELDFIQQNWETIREEVMALHEGKVFEQTTNPESASYYDLGFRTFYKYGWSKFYLTWYGHSLKSAKELCPKTVAILETIPSVNGAMISILPPGSKLTRHLDPIACSLRYHLGLSTPNSNDCFINVDGKSYSWKDGEAFIFDETYLHYAQNNSDKNRLILMCDIERPMSLPGQLFNFFYKSILRLSVVPNMPGDKSGLINTIFSKLSPILAKTKKLKQNNRPLYLLVKWTVNISLAIILGLIIYGVLKLFGL